MLLQTIIDMSHRLSCEVVAEGVEDRLQLGVFKTLGCDVIQGYYYAKPLTADKFIEFCHGQMANRDL